MVSTLVICSALLGSAPTAKGLPGDDPPTYQQAKEKVGRDPDANVRLALWCEANGLEAERLQHLGVATAVSPAHATARGLMGLVADHGGWRRPDELADAARSDASLQAKLAEYNARREAMPRPESAESHFSMGLWCEENGLRPEAIAHFTSVTRLAPRRADAWKKLGCRPYHGKWVSEAQIAAEEAEAQAQRQADIRWGTKVRQWWKDWLVAKDEADRAGSLNALGNAMEPRTVPTIRTLFTAGDADQQLVAVSLLDRIDAPEASRELARLVAAGRAPEVRNEAAAALSRRDPNEAIDPLIDLLRDPLKVTVLPGHDRNVIGELEVEDEQTVRHKIYVQKTITPQNNPAGRLPSSLRWLSSVVSPRPTRGPTAQQKLLRDVQVARARNAARLAQDAEIVATLTLITGENFGSDPGAWRSWWADLKGVSYDRPYERTPKPTITRVSRTTTVASLGHCRCFAKGTLVKTLFGPRPIETLQVGDRVLTADAETGALGVVPVVAVYHNPPSPTLKLGFGGEALETTPIHRFWKAGKGWVMARDLKPGDSVRAVGGLATVTATQSAETQPVYNLEVADGHSFFVGGCGVLVHDYTLAQTVNRPFDQPPVLADLIGAPGRAAEGHGIRR